MPSLLLLLAIFSPLRELPGPRSKGLFKSHIVYATDPRISAIAQDEWYTRFGPNYVIKGLNWFDNRLLTVDPKAVNYVLNNPLTYEKPKHSRYLLSSLIGPGLLASEGPRNRRQRKLISPAFAPSNLKALTPIFFQKAFELRDAWRAQTVDPENGAKVDVAHWLSRATFDVIGLAGFDYKFNAIQEEKEHIYLAYKVMFDATANKGHGTKENLYNMYPILRTLFPTDGHKVMDASQAKIRKFGLQLITERKEQHHVGKLDRFDILSLLVKANLAEDLSEDQRVTDEEICHHINTFLFAGSDTTSLGVAWGLLLLSQNPGLQTRLRTELVSLLSEYPAFMAPDTAPTVEETVELYQRIDKLPFLENVCREFLRLIPPVHGTIRVALKDDVIPISEPIKYETGKWKGQERRLDGIRIAKDEIIHVPIEGFNVAKHIWGDDAYEFNPDRWNDVPQAAKENPGLLSNLMTFGAGPRSCVGMKFSMMETKTMLFALIPAFTFEPAAEIRKRNVILTRPYLEGSLKAGPQLPLIVNSI
ncbi:cytochrome P450 [Clavulina sp. PMI_390]|nr:cytochrome P450 [Clavulina sp. PMI_390]